MHSNSSRYALALWLATVLALGTSFVLQLEPAQWSGITVWIVFMQDPRLNYSKIIWWAFGTVVGAGMAVLLIVFFNQMPELGLFSLALWLALGAAAARLVNFYRSYGLVLAGYTCAIVFMSSVDHPDLVFQYAVTRVSCIFIGMASAILMIVIWLPKHGHWRETVQHLGAHFRATLRQASRALNPDLTRPVEFTWRHMADRLSTLEHAIDLTTAESADSRIHAPAARSLVATLFDLLAKTQAVEVHLSRPGATPPGPRVKALLARAEAMLGQFAAELPDGQAKESLAFMQDDLAGLRREIIAARESLAGDGPAPNVSSRFVLDRLEEIVDELGRAMQDWSGLFGLWTARRASNLLVHKDYPGAILYGVRMFLAISLASVLWFITQWPNGSQFILFIAVVCSLLSLTDYAPQLGFAFLKSATFCALMAYLETFVLYQKGEGFLVLALALGVFLFPAAYAYRHPRLLGGAVVSMLIFYGLSMPANQMNYDISAFLNNGLALLAATACGFFAFHAVPSFGPEARRFWLLRTVRRELGRGGQADAALSEQGWTSRMFDRLRLLHRAGGEPQGLLEAENEMLVSLQLGLRQRRLIALCEHGGLQSDDLQAAAGFVRRFQDLSRHPGLLAAVMRSACTGLEEMAGQRKVNPHQALAVLAEMWEMTFLLETSTRLYRA